MSFPRYSAAALLLLSVSQPALAQQAPAPQGGVGEIVVTAQRREQNLQDVGVSISALAGKDLHAQGMSNSTDVVKGIPGVLLNSTSGGGLNANLTVRGISQSDYSSIQESPNSIYIDDVYLSSPNAAGFTLYDLQRVEVLRGPQGTLFGRASSGGLANFITARPSKTWNGYAEVGYSSYNDIYAEAAVGGPISDRVRFRLSARGELADGWFKNTAFGGQDAFAKKFFGIHGQLEADLTDSLTARLSLSYDKNPKHADGAYKQVPAYVNGGKPAYLPATVDAFGTGAGNNIYGERAANTSFTSGAFNSIGYLQNERFSPTLYLTYKLGNATVTSITNYTKFKYDYLEDCDAGLADGCQNGLGQSLDQFSQELRLNGKADKLTYTLGSYFLNTRQTTQASFVFPVFSGSDYAFNSVDHTHQAVDSWALFGQAEYQVLPQVKATLGVRYTHDTKRFTDRTYVNELGAGYGGVTGVTFVPPLQIYEYSAANGNPARQSHGLWSGKVGLDYKPAKHALFYLSASRGVKAAGFNANGNGSLAADGSQTPFNSEYVYAYEAGTKLDLLDRKLRVNASVFSYDYHNFQGYAYQFTLSKVSNYKGRFNGAELEVTAVPVEGLTLGLGGSYLDAKLHNVASVYSATTGDARPVLAPKWTFNGRIQKDFELSFGKVSAAWDGNYLGERYSSIDNNIFTRVPASFVHNAHVSVNIADKGLELALFVNNISNKGRMTYSFDTASFGFLVQSFAQPRWVGGSLRQSF